MALSEGGGLGKVPIIKELTHVISSWKWRFRIQQNDFWRSVLCEISFFLHSFLFGPMVFWLSSCLWVDAGASKLALSPARHSCSFPCILNTITRWLFSKYLFHQDPNYDPLNNIPWTSTLRRMKSDFLNPWILTPLTLHSLLRNYLHLICHWPPTLFFHFF